MGSEQTYIFDPESSAELARLINQDRLVTAAMGGALVGLPPLPKKAQVLDLACGPGGWVLDAAFERQDCEIAGVDISSAMIEYANARARTQQRSNASFGIMNITQPLDFTEHSFDLVNARFLMGVLRREAWPSFIAECLRILRPGGILCLTEGDDSGITSSPALETLNTLGIQALWRAGYGFSPNGRTFGMSSGLLNLLQKAGYQDISLKATAMNNSAHTAGWTDVYHDHRIMLIQFKPLLIQLGMITDEEFDRLYQQALAEMHADDFVAVGHLTSVWGRRPL
jgi:ubiquinone/menaquinone biosynthesis C-methylase UbiE